MKILNMKIVYLGLFLLVLFLMSQPAQVAASVAAEGDTDRDETLWVTGHHIAPPKWNPFQGDMEWGGIFMHEILFDYNFEKDEVVKGIGESIEFTNDGETLEITIRSGPKWNTGDEVTVDDVVYSILMHNRTDWGDFAKRVESVEADGDDKVIITLENDFAYSQTIYWYMFGSSEVVNEEAWTLVEDEIGLTGIKASYTCDWTDEDTEDDWKVCSGPYEPWYISSTNDRALFIKRDDWWGADDDEFKDTFEKAPKYIGHRFFPNNARGNEALEKNDIDGSSKFIGKLDELRSRNGNIGNWYNGAPYYVSLNSPIELLINHMKFPFSELWFRQVLEIGCIANLDALDELSTGGYLKEAKRGYIDNESARLAGIFAEDVEDEYNVDDKTMEDALNILAEECLINKNIGTQYDIYDEDDLTSDEALAVGGGWYTKDIDEEVYDTALVRAQYGIVDAFPAIDGINTKVSGPFDLTTVTGWTDHNNLATAIALTFGGEAGQLDITINPEFTDWGGYQGRTTQHASMLGLYGNMTLDILISTQCPKMLQAPIQIFNYFRGAHADLWGNTTLWNQRTSPEAADYVEKCEEFEVCEPGSTDEADKAAELQEILAKNKPSVVLWNSGMWYTFNEFYWKGWPTEANHVFPVTVVWSHTYAAGAVMRMILSLKPGDQVSKVGAGAGSPLPLLPLLAALFGIAMIVSLRRRK
jgi:ABC-type transport system substrate-binding protein